MLSKFPLDDPRRSQVEVLKAIEQAYKDGYRIVLLEAPVGSGKSAIAVTVAKHYGPAHVLTPRKSLQDQYRDDFTREDLITMKGRAAYPCTHPLAMKSTSYEKIVNQVSEGVPALGTTHRNCSNGPCTLDYKQVDKCVLPDASGIATRPCPYKVAIEAASKRKIIVHNLHSFIFQTSFAGYFMKAPILIVDECHDVEGIVRGFASRNIVLPKAFPSADLEVTKHFTTLQHWADWFKLQARLFSESLGSNGVSPRDEFYTKVDAFERLSEMVGEKFIKTVEVDRTEEMTTFKFMPEFVGNVANRLIFDYGEKLLLMSGTIYSKASYCRDNGLKEEEVCFIRIGSSFPKSTRPIYSKPKYQVDTSHKFWDENFDKMCDIIEEVMEVFDDCKGLIHTPSYTAAEQIREALESRTPRLRTHTSENFLEKLQEFYDEEGQPVLLSPVCQQGVDFKYDRAKFQMVLRVPYLNTSDDFVSHKVKHDFRWYNHQALVVFGQQMGRVNRSHDDYGATILVDSRFNKFIARNKGLLPKWLVEAISYS